MGKLANFLHFLKKKDPLEEQEYEDGEGVEKDQPDLELPEVLMDRKQIRIEDEYQRNRYVTSCLEQIADATKQVQKLNEEYQSVNAYLEDMELIEGLPEQERRVLSEQAKAIVGLSADREKYRDKKLHLSDSNYHKMERMQDEVCDGVKKLEDAEEYQQAIRQDLQRLEGEKQACLYRKHESHVGLENLRGMTIICVCAVFACILVLILLDFVFKLDVRIGYILTAAAAAVTLTVIYMKYQDMDLEMRTAGRSLNKIILLQNKVKIRYVNNTNLLDYLYMKYGVGSKQELTRLWEDYVKEREVREKMDRAEEDLDFHEEALVERLKKHHLFDPMVWLHQPLALMNNKEMVEVRHGLIMRRQKLRKQMEFNNHNAEAAQEEIKGLVGDYPHYANEILKMVSEYEEKY